MPLPITPTGIIAAGLTDKGAKDFKEAIAGINEASKSGGLQQFSDMMKSFTDLSQSGAFGMIIRWFELMGVFVEAGGAEAMANMAEIMFSEKNVAIAESLGTAIGKASDKVVIMTDNLDKSTTALGINAKAIKENQEAIENWTHIILLLTSGIYLIIHIIIELQSEVAKWSEIYEEYGKALEDFLEIVKEAIELLEG
jgi:hypothetical protein